MHYVIYAEQSEFVKPYIILNNEKRTQCLIIKDKIGAESYKLMNNCVFGKQSENVRKHMDRRFENNDDKVKRFAGEVTFKDFHILSENVTLYDIKEANILLDKPILLRFTTLEISKFQICMNYGRLKEVYKDNMWLLYTDTNSLKWLTRNKNPYILDEKLVNCFDTSNFNSNTIFPLTHGMNEKNLGCLKFENGEYPAKTLRHQRHTKKFFPTKHI